MSFGRFMDTFRMTLSRRGLLTSCVVWNAKEVLGKSPVRRNSTLPRKLTVAVPLEPASVAVFERCMAIYSKSRFPRKLQISWDV
jgi:hypothetical protein